MNQGAGGRDRGRRRMGGRFVPRFAQEVFRHEGSPDDGPVARKLVSTVAWKQPPSASVRAEVST